ncbi:MAG: type II toxin-antitoxin system VapC family toxin [Candidatus Saccharimonas sp.]|nr:type II toxin-antitoxin system VapC family toxin [Planctomycetaceae bacterium]
MSWLLDTNVWIHLWKDDSPAIRSRIAATDEDDLRVCSIVKAELLYGALRYLVPARRRTLIEATLDPYDSLPFDDAAAEFYARIRFDLERQGQIIGPNDLLIAAICLAHDCTLVTSNTNEFSRVPGLKCEDWSQP